MDEQIAVQTSAPSAPEAPPPPDTTPSSPDNSPPAQPNTELMQLGLTEMAKKEDATDFIEEMRDQKAWKDGDPAASSEARKEARFKRYEPLLEQARQATADALGQQDVVEARIEDARRSAKAEARLEQYEAQNPGFTEYVKLAVETHGDVTPDVARVVWESPRAPEIIDRIYQNPESIEVLNQLSPRELDRCIARMEGLIDGMGQAPAAPKPLPEPKRISSAPPPIKAVTGKSSAPSKPDLHAMAKSEDATAFIEESRRRERARAKDRY